MVKPYVTVCNPGIKQIKTVCAYTTEFYPKAIQNRNLCWNDVRGRCERKKYHTAYKQFYIY